MSVVVDDDGDGDDDEEEEEEGSACAELITEDLLRVERSKRRSAGFFLSVFLSLSALPSLASPPFFCK